ncbi:MAG: hypothetical protein WD049_07535 [Candidatus Paceibacterota bacterium]
MNDWAGSLWRHKKSAGLFFVVVLGAVVLGTLLAPKRFQSEGVLYFRIGRENAALDPTTAVGQGTVFVMPTSRERELRSILEILKSRALLEGIVAAVGQHEILADATGEFAADVLSQPEGEVPLADRALSKLKKGLDVSVPDDTNLIRIRYEGRTPEFAQQVVGKVLEIYVDHHVRIHRSIGTYDFLGRQASDMQKRLTEAEEQLRRLKAETGIVDPESQRAALVGLIGTLQEQLLESDSASKTYAVQLATLTDELSTLPQAKGLAALYTTNHPLLRAVQEQVGQTETVLDAENDPRTQLTESVNRVWEEGQISRLSLVPLSTATEEKSESLRKQLAAARQELIELAEVELQIVRMQRQVDLADMTYRKYVSSVDQARLDEALEVEQISNVNVVQPATLEPKHVSPNLLLNGSAGFLAALIGAVSLAFYLDRLKDTVASPKGEQRMRPSPPTASQAPPHTNGERRAAQADDGPTESRESFR